MTDALGTLTILGVTIPSEELPSYFHCDITFGWHGKDENLSGADTILTMTGIMIQGDPRAAAQPDEKPAFLQLFAITGGTGKYVGAKGQVTIGGSLGLQDYPSGDVLPENVLRFYGHFSVPMTSHLAADFVAPTSPRRSPSPQRGTLHT